MTRTRESASNTDTRTNHAADSEDARTEVVHGVENASRTIVNFLSNARFSLDISADQNWPSVAMGVDIFRNAMLELKNRRGLSCRFITDIAKSNLPFCKELIGLVGADVRHLPVKGNFAVSESEYIASATMTKLQELPQVI